MSTLEQGKFTAYAEAERDWLGHYVHAGIFNFRHLNVLQQVHDQILHAPETYLREVAAFERQMGLGSEWPIIYVARLIVPKPEPDGIGFNIVFSPSDPHYQEVASQLYPRTHDELLRERLLPFGVFWADAYYYQGSAYQCGKVEGSLEESGYEVFHVWEQTWSALHNPKAAVFFILAPPYIPQR